MYNKNLLLRVIVIYCTILFAIDLIEARSPPYFGPSDRQIRAPAQSKLTVESPLDIFLLELLPFKAQFVLKNVRANCSELLAPMIDTCYKNYELESKYTLAIKGTTEELKVGCCNLWKYHECVIDAVESLAHYSFKACNEYDADAAEQVLEATESHPKSKLMCSDYHRQSFYCSTFIESSLGLSVVLLLGLTAVVVAALLAGFMFYLSTLRTKIVYIQARANGGAYNNDGVELIERN